MDKSSWHGIEPIQFLYAGMVVFFAVAIVFCEWMFPNDGQIFQVFGNVLMMFAGVLVGRKLGSTDGDGGQNKVKTTVGADGTTEVKVSPQN